MKRFQLISEKNRGLFDIIANPDGEVWLSTVELAKLLGTAFSKYETCLFSAGGAEVVAEYDTLDLAVAGHEFYRKKYGLE